MRPARMPKSQLDGSKALIVPVLPALVGLQLSEKNRGCVRSGREMKVCLSRNGDEAAGRESLLRGTWDLGYD